VQLIIFDGLPQLGGESAAEYPPKPNGSAAWCIKCLSATRDREVRHAIHPHESQAPTDQKVTASNRIMWGNPPLDPCRGSFSDRQSCLNLPAARLRYIAGMAWSTSGI
jgi:hypothetical protein